MNRRELFTGTAGNAACHAITPRGAQRIPNVVMRTHENRVVRFYDDLIKDRQVLINMMYATCEGYCPVITMRLVEIHEALHARMGRDLFMYSITLKPEQDDPAALKEFARMHGALLPGWTFLTGDAYDIDTLRYELFRHDHIKIDADLDAHAGQMRIINDATNRWLHVAPMASKMTVLQHIAWADPPKSFEQRLEENRRLQERIDQEVELYGYRKVI
ncbi:MAG: SCO family protein [Proteobacteria bacterium]|nr:MAG: SCO family protein [Pseudomonadota bacterium]